MHEPPVDGLCRRCQRDARAAAYRRELATPRACAECGEEFVPGEVHGRYCSTRCRMRAYRARRKPAA
jgi:hypothetical protein